MDELIANLSSSDYASHIKPLRIGYRRRIQGIRPRGQFGIFQNSKMTIKILEGIDEFIVNSLCSVMRVILYGTICLYSSMRHIIRKNNFVYMTNTMMTKMILLIILLFLE